ncbi:PAS domain S-box protein [Candidatus Lokiarchaeum ossiferum]|uniref:PAS domain S-box protein n=1 Tax=Candidatus Lokiarchaeum ossiferum TaxID=2951803 RepID=UPI00352E6552
MNLQPPIFEFFDNIVHIIDREYRIISVNQAFIDYCKKLSIDPSVVGKSLKACFSFIPEKVWQDYATVFETGHPIKSYEEIEINNHHFLSTTQKIPIKNGEEIIGILTMIDDQTLDLTKLDRLEKNERILDMTQELSKIGGWVWNPNNKTTFWTAETFRIHGIKPTHGKFDPGNSVELSLECYNPEDKKVVLEAFNKCCDHGIPYDLEFEFTALDGNRKWIRSKAQPIIENDEIIAVLGALQDITEDHQNRERIRTIERFEQEKAVFLAQIALSEDLRQGNFEQLSHFITEEVVTRFNYDRVGIWMKDPVSQELKNLDIFEKIQQQHFSGLSLSSPEKEALFSFFTQTNILILNNTAIQNLKEHYLQPYILQNRINSLLMAKISNGEELLGVLSFEFITADHTWNQVEVNLAHLVADQLALAMSNSIQRQNRIKINQLAGMLDVAPNSIYIVDFKGNFLYANDFACKMHGFTKEEFLHLTLQTINEPGTAEKIETDLANIRQEKELRIENIHVRKDGSHFPVLIHAKQVHWDSKPAVLVIGIDLSERKKMEDELLQSRKMDAIGQLSAGIAHDFNNILGSILGMAEVIKEFADLDQDTSEYVNNIILDANRGAMLTRKLLSFGRKDKKPFSFININDVVQDVGAILSRSVNKKIQLKFNLDAHIPTFLGNFGQIETAILNLGINASQAMENGGTLKFSTGNVEITREYPQSNLVNLEPGKYIEIAIQDTGIGIPKEHLDKLFDPFFTTKEPGKGTGLGLAVTFGTVKDHKGEITVQSKIGEGSVFKIFLPVSQKPNYTEKQKPISMAGSGKILLVDDEKSIRISGKKILESFGYSVHLAATGKDAITYFRDHHSEIELILLDMIMPDMSGVETYYELKKIQDDCVVIVVSGYCREDELATLKENGVKDFIQKPYQKDELGYKIKQILEIPKILE